ncbi:MAG: hypothetical protein BWK80_38555 [Desulfobacteraceae bacterium IS3]|nr:MAG: hypothetical protein BWK80_38555 [Desulfobacteraceae bacterium IS3]HAO19648.1 hypothetical protein [Desulfobacteraceae bacterium]
MKKKCKIILCAAVIVCSACSMPQPVYESKMPMPQQRADIEKPATPPSDKKARRIGEMSSAKPASPIGKSAVEELIRQTRAQMEKGQLKPAFATAERGLAIDSSDARIWSLMAEIQLKQNNPAQAEQLAKKSNLLAKGNKRLQAKNWRIIAEALRRKGADKEADGAVYKASELEKQSAAGG